MDKRILLEINKINKMMGLNESSFSGIFTDISKLKELIRKVRNETSITSDSINIANKFKTAYEDVMSSKELTNDIKDFFKSNNGKELLNKIKTELEKSKSVNELLLLERFEIKLNVSIEKSLAMDAKSLMNGMYIKFPELSELFKRNFFGNYKYEDILIKIRKEIETDLKNKTLSEVKLTMDTYASSAKKLIDNKKNISNNDKNILINTLNKAGNLLNPIFTKDTFENGKKLNVFPTLLQTGSMFIAITLIYNWAKTGSPIAGTFKYGKGEVSNVKNVYNEGQYTDKQVTEFILSIAKGRNPDDFEVDTTNRKNNEVTITYTKANDPSKATKTFKYENGTFTKIR